MNIGDESHIGTTGFSLIDFKTRELYTLSDPYRGYMIRDYYIQFDIRENGHDRYIDLTIFLCTSAGRKIKILQVRALENVQNERAAILARGCSKGIGDAAPTSSLRKSQ